ncbi:MAG: hypothetical protein DMF61_11350 [Blastocatellia bacterium AA13]|nr:MAG: hypothetical protein DMF61_11350 [Blastocatellia bacterium AA13]
MASLSAAKRLWIRTGAMRALRYVHKLHETLREVDECGGNGTLFVILDYELVGRLREYAFTYLKYNTVDAGRGSVEVFLSDLVSRDIFNSRVRYCVAKLQEFSIPRSKHFELITRAIALHLNGSNGWGHEYKDASSVSWAFVSEMAKCFEPWYRPDDVFLLDFATEHCLCFPMSAERRWSITALGRYVLGLQPLESIIVLLATEVALSQRLQSRFVSDQLVRDLRSRDNTPLHGLPYSLRMFDVVKEDPRDIADSTYALGKATATLTPLGERVIDTLFVSGNRLRELVLVMLESETEGIRAFPQSDKYEITASFEASVLLTRDDRASIERSTDLARHGAYVDALRVLLPLIERVVNAIIQRAGLQDPGVGMAKKMCLLEANSLLSHEMASFAEIVVTRNKVAHGNIGRNDNLLLKPLFEFALGYFSRLIQEADSRLSQSAK